MLDSFLVLKFHVEEQRDINVWVFVGGVGFVLNLATLDISKWYD